MTEKTEHTLAEAIFAISEIIGPPSSRTPAPRTTAQAYVQQRGREEREKQELRPASK